MKKLIALLLVLVMVLGLVACGAKEDKPAEAAKEETKTEEKKEESKEEAEGAEDSSDYDPMPPDYVSPVKAAREDPSEPIEIVWVTGRSDNGKEDYIIQKWEEIHPNVKIKLIDSAGQNQDNDTIIKTMIGAGEQIDLWWADCEQLVAAAATDSVLPIDEFLKEDGDEFIDMFGEVPAAQLTYGGKYYGFPQYYNTFLILYNKTMLDEKGITISATPSWDEVVKAAQAANDPENGVYGWVFPIAWDEMNYTAAELSGWTRTVADADGNVKPNFDSPILKASMEATKNLAAEYGVCPDLATYRAESINRRQYLASGQTAIIADGPYSLIWLQNYMFNDPGEGALDFEIGCAAFPYLEGGEDSYYAKCVGAWGIPATSANPYWAYEFIKYMETDPVMSCLMSAYFSTFRHFEDYGTTMDEHNYNTISMYTDMYGEVHTDIYSHDLIHNALAIPEGKTPYTTVHNYNWDLAGADALMYLLFADQYELYYNGEMEFDEWAAYMNDLGAEQLAQAGLDKIG